jgi:NAD(P)H-hydrate epimerase
MEIVTADEMRRIDRYAIRTLKIPSPLLMESAGLRVAESVDRFLRVSPPTEVFVICGKGNNGGDGLIAARHLAASGWSVTAVLAADPRTLTVDAAGALREAQGAQVALVLAPTPAAWRRFKKRLGPEVLVVDALLGTGLMGAARGLAAVVIEDVVASGAPVIAVDLPSGLSGDTAEVPGAVMTARSSVALCRPKISHLLPPACVHAGAVEVADIGIPPEAVASVRPRAWAIERADLLGFLPRRARDAHKGAFGHALVVAGSVGMAGAAALASRAALRAGAGLATAMTPAAVRAEVASFTPEVMTAPLPEGSPAQAARALLEACRGKSAVAVGPGLGRDAHIAETVRRFVTACRTPLVLDADGLNAFAGRLAELARARRTLVLTPHPGEAAHLLEQSTAEILKDRLAAARRMAEKARAVVVLKGMASIVAAPDGRAYVNRTGNPGMASGGTGDVLTGILAGLLARGLDPLRTVLYGVHLHGLAGDHAARAIGEEPMMASDLLAHLPAAFRELGA